MNLFREKSQLREETLGSVVFKLFPFNEPADSWAPKQKEIRQRSSLINGAQSYNVVRDGSQPDSYDDMFRRRRRRINLGKEATIIEAIIVVRRSYTTDAASETNRSDR